MEEEYLIEPYEEEALEDKLEKKKMPTTIEDFILKKKDNVYLYKCDSCPNRSRTIYLLIVGDTELVKICPCCKRRLKKIFKEA